MPYICNLQFPTQKIIVSSNWRSSVSFSPGHPTLARPGRGRCVHCVTGADNKTRPYRRTSKSPAGRPRADGPKRRSCFCKTRWNLTFFEDQKRTICYSKAGENKNVSVSVQFFWFQSTVLHLNTLSLQTCWQKCLAESISFSKRHKLCQVAYATKVSGFGQVTSGSGFCSMALIKDKASDFISSTLQGRHLGEGFQPMWWLSHHPTWNMLVQLNWTICQGKNIPHIVWNHHL